MFHQWSHIQELFRAELYISRYCVYACMRAFVRVHVCVCARARALFITWKGLVIKYEYLYIIAVLVNSLECCINYYLLT